MRRLLLLLCLLGTSELWGAIGIDVTVSTDRSRPSTNITSPTFSTTSPNELLLAFVATDAMSPGVEVTSVSGARLNWVLVRRANDQLGTAEIWRAFSPTALVSVSVRANLSQRVAASITVLTFTGTDPSGTNGAGAIGASSTSSGSAGPPTATVVSTRAGSWVFGVGNNWDHAIVPTVDANQTMVHEYLATVGDTYWVQCQNTTTPLSGMSVTINDLGPTNDRYNLAIVEVLPALGSGPVLSTYGISGTITPASNGAGAMIALSGDTSATTTADANGNYSFAGLTNGTSTVTPSKPGFTFSPASQTVTINGASQAASFTISPVNWSIQGSVSGGSGATVTLTLGSMAIATAIVDSSGNYMLNGVPDGTYSVTSSKKGYAFVPPSQSVTVSGAAVVGINFVATQLPTYSISGVVSLTGNSGGVSVTLSGAANETTSSDAFGAYSFSGLANGTYTVVPVIAGFTVSPPSQTVVVNGSPVSDVNFTVVPGLAIDVVAYGDSNSASATAVTQAFSTNASNELLLAFIATDGSSNGVTVTSVAGGGLTWELARRTNVQLGTAEIWRAFAPFPLSNISVSGALSQQVASSITVVGFTGAESSGANGSGAIGASASASASPGAAGPPSSSLVTTRNNSWVIGVGNDWDNALARTPGPNQTMVHQSLASVNDTYWVQRQNSTTPLAGTAVSINDTAPTGDRYNLSLVEVLPAAPWSISGSVSPAASSVGATLTLAGTSIGTTTVDATGNYTFGALTNGTYTITPSATGYSFSPVTQLVTIDGASVVNVNFAVIGGTPLPITVTISPTLALLSAGGTQQFTAATTNTTNTAVTWSATGGAISSSGAYTAPGMPGTYTVTATSVADTSKSASATVMVTASTQVSISPTSASVLIGATQQFTAAVTGTTNTGVTWSVTGGSISSSGLYTAPAMVGTYAVTVTSLADTSKSASAVVTVRAPASGGSTAAGGLLLGDQSVEAQQDALSVGRAQAFQATANASGNVQSLVVYLDASSTVSQLVTGLYADAGGHPGALLGQGSSTQLQTGAWNPISVPAIGVVAGTPYWIAILGTGSGTAVLRSASSGCLAQNSADTTSTALPTTWNGSGTQTCPLSVFADSGNVVFFDGFDGTTLDSAWTVISRHGEYSQNETECNVPGAVTLSGGNLVITTSAQAASCGDFNTNGSVRTPPSVWPYTTGDVQWDTLNFMYGTLEFRTTYPSASTNLWPAHWLLGSNCQTTNKYTGDTIPPCPNFGTQSYDEIDVVECYGGGCRANLYHNSSSQGCWFPDPNWDANPHTFVLNWQPNSLTLARDGTQICSWSSNIPSTPMFLIMQTQTGGVAGTPNNSLLPATLVVDYVKVTQP